LPRNKSLIELGVIDSFGVVELIAFIEEHWNITIDDVEITPENMGGIEKMSTFVASKLTKTA
jgi:acyl carrier protein